MTRARLQSPSPTLDQTQRAQRQPGGPASAADRADLTPLHTPEPTGLAAPLGNAEASGRDGVTSRPSLLLGLQQTYGNQAVQQYLQRAPNATANSTAAPTQQPAQGAPKTQGIGVLTPEEQAFFNLTGEASSRVQVATGNFSAWLSSITIPYAQAWSAHQAAMKAADAAAKNANALVLGLILAMVPGGIGGQVGRAMQNLGAGAAMVDGIKDLAKFGLRAGGSAAADLAPGGGKIQSMPADPLVWQNQTNLRAETEVLTPARTLIVTWQHAVNQHNPDFDIHFDPVAAVNSALTMSGQSLFGLPAPPGDLQQSYERGFLADWIQSEAGPVFMSLSQFASGKAWDKLVSYGKRIGMEDVDRRLSDATSAAVQENNRRAIASGHGLI